MSTDTLPAAALELIDQYRSRIADLELQLAQHSAWEKELVRSEQKAQGLLEAAPDAVIVANQDGEIVLINAQAERLFGYSKSELIGKPIEHLVPERFRNQHEIHRSHYESAPSTRPMGAELQLFAQHKNGKEFPVEISLSPFQAGDVTLISSAIRNVTQRVEVEAELRTAKEQAEKANRIKSQFLAAASHDLRQPLQAARLYLAAALAQPQNLAPLGKLDSCLTSLADLLSRLLNVAKLDAGAVTADTEDFPIGRIFQRLKEEFYPQATEKGIGLRFVATKKWLLSDPELLHQALANLVANAIRYTDHGRIIVGCRSSGQHFRIQVWDSGFGISEDQVEQIFEEFYQIGNPARDRGQGTGLGLTIVQRVATLLNAEVRVQSKEGQGSLFELVFPIESVSATAPADCSETSRFPQNFIAVIDDDVSVLESLQLALQATNHEVIAGTSQRDLLQKLRKTGRAPDFVVSDYRLEDGLTGIEALDAIRAEFGASIPGLLLTGDTSLPTLEEIGVEKHFRVLSKPMSLEDLNREIGTCLASSKK